MRELSEKAQELKKKSLTAMLLAGVPLILQWIWEWFIAPVFVVFVYIAVVLVVAIATALLVQYQGTMFGLIVCLIIGAVLLAVSVIIDIIHWCMTGSTVVGLVKCILNLKKISELRREDKNGVTRSMLSTGTCFDVIGICASAYYLLIYVIWPLVLSVIMAVIFVLYIAFVFMSGTMIM